MHDLIYRDDLIKSIPVDWPTTVRAIEEAPAVDAVEVVRCKDCKWLEEATEEYEAFCNNIYGLNDYVCGDDFCSYGERKEGADNVY